MKQENQESVGDRILQIRVELGRPSQERFGRSLGVTKSTVSQWELGKTEPSPENLFAIETVYGYRAKWILKGELPKIARNTDAEQHESPALIFSNPSPIEQELLSLIRGLTPEQQDNHKKELEEINRKNLEIYKALRQQIKDEPQNKD